MKNSKMVIHVNRAVFVLDPSPSSILWAPVVIDGAGFFVDHLEALRTVAGNRANVLTIKGYEGGEITIDDCSWVRRGSGTYVRAHTGTVRAQPFPHAGQVGSLHGTDVEVLHFDRGMVFWYNPEEKIHGMVKAEKLKVSLAETLRADIEKGLTAKELIALGWSRDVC
jgi:hypothetical protein